MAQLPAPEYLRTLNRFPGDGSTTIFNFTFTGGYLDRPHVKALILDADTRLTKRQQVIQAGDFIGPFQLRILPAPAANEILVIYRDTPKDLPLVDFTDGAILNERNLDRNAKQAVFIAAEAFDQVTNAITAAEAAAALAVAAQLAAQASAAVALAAEAALMNFSPLNALQPNRSHAVASYTLPVGHNAISGGPITIDPGVTISISPDSTWTIP